MKNVFLLIIIMGVTTGHAQITKSALFLGNSYTAVNNLPNLVWNMAESTGDSLIYDSNTPGGYTLQGHSTNTTSLTKIMSGNWDYVVLQDQSQLPSFPDAQVQSDVYPYARKLNDTIRKYNECAETIFYMTWGRKNGDASNCPVWPPVCTYQGMDSLLRLRYEYMADDNQGILSPVGAAWRYDRTYYPTIELYSADESHPSAAGSYLAACSFYTVIYRKDPSFIAWDYSLSATDANILRQVAKAVVYDSLMYWNVGKYDPVAGFNTNIVSGLEYEFQDTSMYSDSVSWNFGDGTSANGNYVTHTYPADGTYLVTQIVKSCQYSDTAYYSLTINTTSVLEKDKASIFIYPNPGNGTFIVTSQNTTEYSIFNAIGQSVCSGLFKQGEQTLNIAYPKQGIYFLKTENATYRLVISEP